MPAVEEVTLRAAGARVRCSRRVLHMYKTVRDEAPFLCLATARLAPSNSADACRAVPRETSYYLVNADSPGLWFYWITGQLLVRG